MIRGTLSLHIITKIDHMSQKIINLKSLKKFKIFKENLSFFLNNLCINFLKNT